MADGKPNNNYRQRNRNHSYENDGKFRREVREPTSWRNNNPARSNGNRPEPNQHRDTKQRSPRRDDQLSKDKFMSFNFLKNLSTMESDTAIATLADKSQQFEELLKKEMRPDIIVLVIQILSNICQGNFAANLTRILQCACSKEFFDSLEKYLQSLCFEKPKDELKNKFYHEDTKRFWSNLFAFLKRSMELMPNTTSNIVGHFLESLREIVSVLKASKKIVIEEVDVDEITSMMQNSTIHQRAKNSDNNVCGEKVGDEEPPNDFREISVIPTFEDLIEKNPFLNTCKLNDAYKSVDHYLDTQFRLLREDFVRPLRNGIDAYLNEEKKYRNDDFRIYKNAKLIKFEISKRNVGYKLFFGKLNFIKNWQRSKRFMFGGLLLLSRDNFKSIVFLTVANRDEKDLAEGFVTVEPCSGNKITSDMYECNFILLESKSYFEPYYEVLTAMKKIDETNFPMKKYIVDVETSSSLPKYLNNNLILKFKGNNILPTSPGSIWPSADQLGLDESQYIAFKDAITQEFAIIQGPPGTGKTFLALEIARTLLENARYWRMFGPMVVVCLTNHALDQFLEGILKYTELVIRVGSRSKNEHLKKYSLMEQRKRFRGATHNSLLYRKKVESENILREMLELGTILDDLTREKCIVPLSHLRFCSNSADSPNKIFKTSEELIYWLTDLRPESKKPKESQFHGMDEDVFESGNFLDEENNTVTDADVVLESSTSVNDCETPFFPLQFLDEQINLINENMNKYKRSNMSYLLRASQRKRNEIEWDLMHHPLKNPAELIYRDRWTRYWHWVKLAHDSVKNKLLGLEEMYRGSQEELNEVKELANLEVMKGFSVVGLTTTCAAKIQSSLRALKAPIVLVEEAAEILESHVVCSMTKDCQHAILIGDHKQLRPKASVYELGKNYNLNISLFERMVNVRGECNQLMYQHRMRPQIANLITPSIYEKLYNHESVLNYPKVKGIENDVFFLDHRVHETGYQNEESYVNIHEVDFFVAFAKHLLFQGYEPSEITILCTYTGQLFSFMNEMPKHSLLKQVRVTTVDNFQGEENKIILLSLVRNNGEGKVGFLKEENRVCVALSRAREGLYIMGNMSDLLVKNDIWPKINEVLKNSNAIGEFLKIRCQIHHDKIFEMKTAEDFKQCPEGGCSEVCGLLLNCGHLCKSLCHILDRAHEKYKCHDACNKSCPNEHPCPLKCYQECRPCQVKIDTQLKCSHTVPVPCHIDPNEFVCPVMVEITLTDCNHKMRKHCFVPDESVQCDHYCEIRLPCGHACSGVCHVRTDPDHLKYVCLKKCMKKNIDCMDNHICKKRCSEKCIPCPVLVDKTRSCGHVYKHFKCSLNVEEIFCEQQCEKELSCGHKCRGKCSSACPPCQERVFKESSCGHMIKIKCSEEALPSKCYKNCPKILPCGHHCANKCSESCTTECKQLVKLSQPGLCGHIFSVPCYKKNSDPLSPDLLRYCENPCGFQLLCEHTCRGSCGMCLRGRIHRPCKEPCRTIFICGHECNILCNQECQPCTRTCEVRCSHSKCNKRCGAPCVQCEEPCDRGCIHQRCSKLCHELCDIEPCNEPCKVILTCGHPCVGFCGDPCPPLCRICDYDELATILFGNEDDPDARFIFLPDCKHCIESEALIKWVTDLSENDKEVQVRTCPRCKTPIKSCMRIMNQIKSDLLDVWEVKRRLFSRNANDLNVKQKNYLEVLEVLRNDPIAEIFIEFKTFCRTLQTVGGVIKENRKQNLSFNEINAFKNILDVLSEISDVLKKIESWSSPHEFIKQQVKFLIGSLPKELKISRQRLEDIQLELRRLHLMVQIYNISSKNPFASTVQEYTLVMNMLTSNQRFTDKIEKEVLKIDLKKINAENLRIEREAIIKAVGLSKGHWFKCPNGHFYAIGECGGAMQVGKCIECGAQIGGTNHTLLRTNTLATELDGAQQPAWPNVLYR